MPAPLIGISCNETDVTVHAGELLLPHRTAFSARYAQAVSLAGGLPVMLTPGVAADARQLAGRLDGLLISGGADLHPYTYRQPPHPLTVPGDELAEQFERQLLRFALDRDLPVLAVCRGMQQLNVSRGGTLHQHLPDLTSLPHRAAGPGPATSHEIRCRPDSLLAGILGETCTVNSLHHQAARQLGAGLVADAWAPDGIVEAVSLTGPRFCVGVQWHPESMCVNGDPRQLRLFETFVAACG